MSASSREARFFSGLPELPPDTVDFANHYLTLPAEGNVPSVQDFLDRPPFKLMPRVVIADMPHAQDFKVRFFGTVVAELLARDYTGLTAIECRDAGFDISFISRGWAAVTHPCGFLARRLIYRQNRPERPEAVFELLTLSLPISPHKGVPGIVHYYSDPVLAANQRPAEPGSVGIKVLPICWVDVGAGITDMPI